MGPRSHHKCYRIVVNIIAGVLLLHKKNVTKDGYEICHGKFPGCVSSASAVCVLCRIQQRCHQFLCLPVATSEPAIAAAILHSIHKSQGLEISGLGRALYQQESDQGQRGVRPPCGRPGVAHGARQRLTGTAGWAEGRRSVPQHDGGTPPKLRPQKMAPPQRPP